MEFPPDLAKELRLVLYEEYGSTVSLDDAKDIGEALTVLFGLILTLHE